MKKILLGILFLLSTSVALAETFTAEISGITQTSASITVTGSDIQKTGGFSVLSVKLTGIGPELTIIEPGSATCYANVCNFPTTTKTISGLTCNRTYRGTVQVINSLNTLSKAVEIRTSSCQAGITVTFDSITSSGENKALIKLKAQDSNRPAPGLNIKAEFTPIPNDPLSPTPEDLLIFSRPIGTISTPSNETAMEKEVDISCTDGTTPKKYSVIIEATRTGTNPPVVGRSQPIQFTTDLCPEEPPVQTGGGNTQTEGDNTYIFLTPLPFSDGLQPQKSVEIGATGEDGILGILQRIFTLMLVAAVVLAVVYLIIGGARYATGDTLGGVQGGRQIITNAVTGLLFALLAWLLLNVINPDLLRFTLVIPNVGKVGSGTGNTMGTNTGSSPCAGLTDEECFEKIAEDEERVREIFAAEDINVVGTVSGERPCEAFNERGCTTVGLLNSSMTSKLIEVKRDCVAANPNCKMQITGGTEYWNHGRPPEYNGNHKRFVAVDLQLTEAVHAPFKEFIEGKTKVANPFDICVDTYSYKGLRFCNENRNHWHVDLSTGSGGGGSTGDRLIKFENIGKNNLGVYGKANGRPITPSDVDTLVTSARSKSWYPEVQRVAGSNAKILTAIIMVESSGDPDKVRTEPDGRKSCGLGQLLTDTAKSLDSSLRNKSVDEICTALKDPSYNIRLSNQHYRSLTGDFKTKVAAYNGGSCVQKADEPDCRGGATGVSANCSGLMRFECPWNSNGCYDQTKPNDRPTNTSCQVNTGYEVTRFYVDKVKKISDEL